MCVFICVFVSVLVCVFACVFVAHDSSQPSEAYRGRVIETNAGAASKHSTLFNFHSFNSSR